MTLLQAHRVLIASSIVVCGIYTIRQIVYYTRDNSIGTLLSGGIALFIGVILSCYPYSLRRR